MFREDDRMQGAGLNEKRLLNHDLLGESVETDEVELGPARSDENGTGSIVTATSMFVQGERR
jgi:hypothetical protein